MNLWSLIGHNPRMCFLKVRIDSYSVIFYFILKSCNSKLFGELCRNFYFFIFVDFGSKSYTLLSIRCWFLGSWRQSHLSMTLVVVVSLSKEARGKKHRTTWCIGHLDEGSLRDDKVATRRKKSRSRISESLLEIKVSTWKASPHLWPNDLR